MPAFPQPSEHHQWLAKFTGKWTLNTEAKENPDESPKTCKGLITAESLGSFWMVLEYNMNMTGAPMRGLQTLGYDADKRKHIGTWVDSMTGHMWRYTGEVDEAGKKLILNAEGPNMMKPNTVAMYRDCYEFKSDEEFVMTSQVQTSEGEWVTFMTGTAKRVP